MILWLLIVGVTITLGFRVKFLEKQGLKNVHAPRRARHPLAMAIQLKEVDLRVPSVHRTVSFYKTKLPELQDELDGSRATFSLGKNVRVMFSPFDNTSGRDFEMGESLWGFTIAQPDVNALLSNCSKSSFIRKFGEYKFGASLIPDEDEKQHFPVKYAWLKDPTGFTVDIREDNCEYTRLVLNVIDIEESIAFYSGILGYSHLRHRSNVNNRPRDTSFSAYLGNDHEKEDGSLELRYQYTTETIKVGDSLREIKFHTDSWNAVKDALEAAKKPFELLSASSLTVQDPNGYKLVVESRA